jgi:BirA family transcriptional regulator, biotin operon repressor / biotin---[acetyl-CoA-carboxylase] ligase
MDSHPPKSHPEWLHWLDSCPSTNTWAIAQANTLSHGSVIFTRHQTAGRGQKGRIWHAANGVLTASFILDVSTAQLSGLSLAAGLAVIHALETLLPELQQSLRLKWPNDVLVEGCKLAGILCEATSGCRGNFARVVVGIGLNHCVDFAAAGLTPQHIGTAISLHQLVPQVPTDLVVLKYLRQALLECSKATFAGLTPLLPELRDRDLLRHASITFVTAGESFSGQGAGIDSVGRLLLKLPDGKIKAFATGQVLEWTQSPAREEAR